MASPRLSAKPAMLALLQRPLLALAVAPAGLLAAALFSQYALGLHPCHLCILQRIPYGVMIVIGLLGHCFGGNQRNLWLLVLLALLAGEMGIATYHSGVEWHLINGPSDCTTSNTAGQSIEALRAQILGATVARCDEPVWMVPGLLSMANINFLAALALFAYGMQHWRRSHYLSAKA